MTVPKTMRQYTLNDGKLAFDDKAGVQAVGDYEVQVNSTSPLPTHHTSCPSGRVDVHRQEQVDAPC